MSDSGISPGGSSPKFFIIGPLENCIWDSVGETLFSKTNVNNLETRENYLPLVLVGEGSDLRVLHICFTFMLIAECSNCTGGSGTLLRITRLLHCLNEEDGCRSMLTLVACLKT